MQVVRASILGSRYFGNKHSSEDYDELHIDVEKEDSSEEGDTYDDNNIGSSILLTGSLKRPKKKTDKVPNIRNKSVGISSPGKPSVGSNSPGKPSVGSNSPGKPSIGSNSPGKPSIGISSPGKPSVGSSSTDKLQYSSSRKALNKSSNIDYSALSKS